MLKTFRDADDSFIEYLISKPVNKRLRGFSGYASQPVASPYAMQISEQIVLGFQQIPSWSEITSSHPIN